MRSPTLRSLVMVSAALVATPLIAVAQGQYGTPSQNVAPPPPETQRLEEGEPPAVNIRQPDTKEKITEKKSQGRVTEVKVQTGRSTYYAHPNDAAGSAMRGDAGTDTTRPVQFHIGEFGPPKVKEAPEPVQTLEPNPNAPK